MQRPSLPSTSSDTGLTASTVAADPGTGQGNGPASTGHRRRTGRALLLVGIVAVLSVLGVSCTKNAAAYQSVQLTNGERSSRGLGNLAIDDTLVNKAQAWAENMAAAGGISHSKLTDGAGDNWHVLAENVAVAGSVEQTNNLFMNSPGHRANILNGSFKRIGTGVAEVGGHVYVAQVFAG